MMGESSVLVLGGQRALPKRLEAAIFVIVNEGYVGQANYALNPVLTIVSLSTTSSRAD
jgi:NAD dependent epimerase/dehydratase family enzyme